MLDNNLLPNIDLTPVAITLPPDAPPLYNKDGSLNWAPLSSGVSTWQNPLSYLYNKYKNKTNNLVSNIVLSYQVLSGLEIKSSFGYTSLPSNELTIYTLAAVAPELRPASSRSASYGNNSSTSWIIEPQANYNKAIGR